MPFGKKFRLGGGSPTVIGAGDGDANLDALGGGHRSDFTHLSGSKGKVELGTNGSNENAIPTDHSKAKEEPMSKDPAESQPSSQEHLYRLETADELESRDQEEVISVPMIYTVEKMSLKKILGKRETERRITFRKMRRGQYRAHYAKDPNTGEYIGTEKAAFDAGLVYVHSSTADAIDKQMHGVAYGKLHYPDSYPIAATSYAGVGT